ncbi:MarR family winged helix-turn-helix transcriptional regulator [Actinacidiphila guanduensis]|jgi:DNA-binding MarR family transcriptional regulator|uniref:DNA-binding transcriptional regulator, MarR family n=1 Tax=Actinacidiphila guanduensis TaxID=310781 RepID=A0A1H0BK58_9ACTN|nr:MarR family transcriptional regulator [Actinacidiphila guanduensis]SDN45935.1 DNA-binding transcriptional regulator, MarR family [Actinacidiphila guanduensis]
MTGDTKSDPPSAEIRATATKLRISIGAFRRRVQETLAAGDVTNPQLTVLSRLDRFGPASTAELARREQITPQAMGATVAALEKRGMVERSPDPEDGRRSILKPTPAGRDALGSGRSAIVDKVAHALAASFTEEEIATLDSAAALIERLAGQL